MARIEIKEIQMKEIEDVHKNLSVLMTDGLRFYISIWDRRKENNGIIVRINRNGHRNIRTDLIK